MLKSGCPIVPPAGGRIALELLRAFDARRKRWRLFAVSATIAQIWMPISSISHPEQLRAFVVREPFYSGGRA